MAAAAFSSELSALSPELQLAARARQDAAKVESDDWCDKPTVPCQCSSSTEVPCPRCIWTKAAPERLCPGCWAERQTRAATTIAALHRYNPDWLRRTCLHLAFVGVDQEECSTAGDFLRTQLGSLMLYLLRKTAVQHLFIHAAGPCCVWPDISSQFRCTVAVEEGAPFEMTCAPIAPAASHEKAPSSPLSPLRMSVYPLPDLCNVVASNASAISERSLTVKVSSCKTGWEEYDTAWRQSCAHTTSTGTCLLFLPNAGLWGYDSWLPALSAMLRSGRREQAVVATSYTLAEAEDDEEVLETAVLEGGSGACVAWGPERTATGSIHLADSKYKVVNNFAWQSMVVPTAP